MVVWCRRTEGRDSLKVPISDSHLQEFDVIKTDLLADTFEDMHISSLDINGWTENNKQLRFALIKHTRPDVLCLQETHIDAGQSIDIEGYLWIGHNRKSKHVRARKPVGRGNTY